MLLLDSALPEALYLNIKTESIVFLSKGLSRPLVVQPSPSMVPDALSVYTSILVPNTLGYWSSVT